VEEDVEEEEEEEVEEEEEEEVEEEEEEEVEEEEEEVEEEEEEVQMLIMPMKSLLAIIMREKNAYFEM
jgi:hypothetical protein